MDDTDVVPPFDPSGKSNRRIENLSSQKVTKKTKVGESPSGIEISVLRILPGGSGLEIPFSPRKPTALRSLL
jgi:hypothetical protein